MSEEFLKQVMADNLESHLKEMQQAQAKIAGLLALVKEFEAFWELMPQSYRTKLQNAVNTDWGAGWIGPTEGEKLKADALRYAAMVGKMEAEVSAWTKRATDSARERNEMRDKLSACQGKCDRLEAACAEMRKVLNIYPCDCPGCDPKGEVKHALSSDAGMELLAKLHHLQTQVADCQKADSMDAQRVKKMVEALEWYRDVAGDMCSKASEALNWPAESTEQGDSLRYQQRKKTKP